MSGIAPIKAKNYDAAAPDRPAGERWVSMSNALVRAGHGLSLPEKRIVAAAVSKLNSTRQLKLGEVSSTRITAQEYAELAECGLPTAYEALQSAARTLFDRRITFFEAAHNRSGRPLKPLRVDMRWVGRCTYHAGEGWVELAWWTELLPHLIGLKAQFTSYKLQQTAALRSVYSWRLLELLARFRSNGWAEYTIEDFRASMEPPPSLTDFGQLARRVIDPAVKELRDKDGWVIGWKAIKAGRRVKAIRFDFTRDPQLRLPIPYQTDLEDFLK